MSKYPIQTLVGAGLLLSLAFSVNESFSGGSDRTKAEFRIACENSVTQNGPSGNSDELAVACGSRPSAKK
jgi:hypothetical protein